MAIDRCEPPTAEKVSLARPRHLAAKAAIVEPRESEESEDPPAIKTSKRRMSPTQLVAEAGSEEETGASQDSLPWVQHQVD